MDLSSLSQTAGEWGRDILCKFCKQARSLESMPSGLVREMLCSTPRNPMAVPQGENGDGFVRKYEHGRYMKAQNGDFLMTPFKCDLCHFRALKVGILCLVWLSI